MSRPHFYKHLEKDSSLRVEVPMRELVERVADMNYGVHQFLSHLVDVRRSRLHQQIEVLRGRGDNDVADLATREGDPLADGIARLLKQGLV